jgi:hypothetical protein
MIFYVNGQYNDNQSLPTGYLAAWSLTYRTLFLLFVPNTPQKANTG